MQFTDEMVFSVGQKSQYRSLGITVSHPGMGFFAVGYAYIATVAILRSFLAEVAQELPTAANVVVGGVSYDCVYALCELAFALFIDLGWYHEAFGLYSCARVCYIRCLAAGYEMDDATLAQTFQQ